MSRSNVDKLEIKCALVCTLALVAVLITLGFQNHPHAFHYLIFFDLGCVAYAAHVFNACAK